jgi:hypothetical protein
LRVLSYVATKGVQTLSVQLAPAPHVPHSSVPPQLSDTVPHVLPSARHVLGVHTQVLAEHVSPLAQLPQ